MHRNHGFKFQIFLYFIAWKTVKTGPYYLSSEGLVKMTQNSDWIARLTKLNDYLSTLTSLINDKRAFGISVLVENFGQK